MLGNLLGGKQSIKYQQQYRYARLSMLMEDMVPALQQWILKKAL